MDEDERRAAVGPNGPTKFPVPQRRVGQDGTEPTHCVRRGPKTPTVDAIGDEHVRGGHPEVISG